MENQESNETTPEEVETQPASEGDETQPESSSDKKEGGFFKQLKSNGNQFKEKFLEIWSHTKGRIKARNQILILMLIIVVVLLWSPISSLLQNLSGVIEVDITSKRISEYCHELVSSNGNSYCVDEDSYNYVQSTGKYELMEMEYTFKVRR